MQAQWGRKLNIWSSCVGSLGTTIRGPDVGWSRVAIHREEVSEDDRDHGPWKVLLEIQLLRGDY